MLKIFRDLKTGKLLQVINEGLPPGIFVDPDERYPDFEIINVPIPGLRLEPINLEEKPMERDTTKQETIRMGIVTAIITLIMGMTILIKDCQLKKAEFEIRKMEIGAKVK